MNTSQEQRISQLPRAMPLSRMLRLALGLAMVAMITPALVAASWSGRGRVAAVFAGLVLFYTLVHYVVGRYLGGLNPWLGAGIAVAPALVVFLQGGVYELGVVAFIGLSLVVIATLGQPGCEVLALPALMLGRRTHLACILFTPLDWIEARVGRH
jgi:hypothetical protein